METRFKLSPIRVPFWIRLKSYLQELWDVQFPEAIQQEFIPVNPGEEGYEDAPYEMATHKYRMDWK